jgi:D-3-phosphoglycerate dehydrogenase / 2-oxoglutarate reductase
VLDEWGDDLHTPRVSRAHALLLENVHATASELLERAGVSVTRHGAGLDEQGLIEALRALPGTGPLFLGIRSKTKVTAAVMEAVPRLAGIGAFCIGTDQIDLEAARDRGVAAFNAPFSSTRSVAELVTGLVIMLARRIFPRDRAAQLGRWDKSAKGNYEVRGKTLGIVGYGHIGSQVSVLAESLGMHVRYVDIVPKLPMGNANVVNELDELLSQSDFVSLHVPRSEMTRGMIGAGEIAKMKQGAYLINYSRGDVVDLEALRGAIESEHLAGAAVDVYPSEPASAGDSFSSVLQGLDNVILTPHIGGSTAEAQANIGREVGQSLISFLVDGGTTGSVSLPEVEVPQRGQHIRMLNIHRNVPGVLSKINQVIAESGANIVGQRLATSDEVGVLVVDLASDEISETAKALSDAIAALDTTVRHRLL